MQQIMVKTNKPNQKRGDIVLIKEQVTIIITTGTIMLNEGENVNTNSSHVHIYDSGATALAYIELSELEAQTTHKLAKRFSLYFKRDRIGNF